MIRLSAFADEGGKTLSEQIKVMQTNGISLLELRSIDGKNVKDFTIEEAKKYKQVLDDNGIKVWSIGSPLGKVEADVDMCEYIKVVRHVFEVAKIFGAQNIRIFSFFTEDWTKDRLTIINNLKLMQLKAEQYGVCLCHENEKHIYGDSPERVIDVLDSVPGLKAVYDPANYLQCGEDIDKCLDLTQSRAYYYHIKDVIAATDELVPAGFGDGKIEKMIDGIVGDTVLTLEPHLRVFSGYGEIDREIMKNKFHFDSNVDAFNTACDSIKQVLIKCGYSENNGLWIKG